MSDVPCRRTRTATSDQNSFVSTPRLRWSRAVLCIIVALLTATRLLAVILKISTWALSSHAQDNGRLNGFDWHEVCRGRETRAGGAHEETERFVVSASSKIYPQIFWADIKIHSEPFLFIRYFFASWPCNAAEKHPTMFFEYCLGRDNLSPKHGFAFLCVFFWEGAFECMGPGASSRTDLTRDIHGMKQIQYEYDTWTNSISRRAFH